MEIAAITIAILSVLVLIVSYLPYSENAHWFIRAWEYPGLQKIVISAILLLGLLLTGGYINIWYLILEVLLFLNIVSLTTKIYPFTPLSTTQLKKAEHIDDNDSISFYIGNVYQKNDNYEETYEQIINTDADVVLLVEVDENWLNEMQSRGIMKAYNHKVLIPQDNYYGMALFSRFPVKDVEKRFLVEDEIPSIRLKFILNSGKEITFYGVHPKPPSPHERPDTSAKDKELLLIADEIYESGEPTVIAGDLNDVAWSRMTNLFLKSSEMLDPRRGRGFYNTFNANYMLFRFPLDHIFCTDDFKYVKMQRLNPCGSDHFHISVKLIYAPVNDNEEKDDLESDEKEIVEEKKNETVE